MHRSPVQRSVTVQDTRRRGARRLLVAPAIALAALALAACAPATAGAARRDATTIDVRRATHDAARRVLDAALADSAFPGAVAAVGSADQIFAIVSVGHLDWAPSPLPDENTIWDLASLTKVVGTTTAVMQLWDAGKIDLDAPVQRYLPEWQGPHKSEVTVRHLLTHASGLPPFERYYLDDLSPQQTLARFLATPLDTVPGARMVYSDIGAILLGKIVERVSGEPLDLYLAHHVFGPLGMTSTLFNPPRGMRARIAPTEIDPWRKRHVWGEVHDENAYALGGVSGHAGLFSSAHDLARFAQMYLRGGTLDGVRILSRRAIDTFTVVQDTAFSNRALGWETPTGTNSAGHRMSSRAFGHTGFTGTSIWIDPARDLFVLLLTNRVNPTRENHKIGAVRVALADSVVDVVDAARAAAPSHLSGSRR